MSRGCRADVAIPTTATGQTRPLNILWRNAWAIVNIGDIGDVPGAPGFPNGASTRQRSAARSSRI